MQESIKSVIFVCLTVCLVFIARTAAAEIRSGAITLSLFIGGYIFEGNQNLDNGPAYGLGLGYAFDKHWAAEAVFNYVDTELDTKELRNGLILEFYDISRKLAGDWWYVGVIARIDIPIDEFFYQENVKLSFPS